MAGASGEIPKQKMEVVGKSSKMGDFPPCLPQSTCR